MDEGTPDGRTAATNEGNHVTFLNLYIDSICPNSIISQNVFCSNNFFKVDLNLWLSLVFPRYGLCQVVIGRASDAHGDNSSNLAARNSTYAHNIYVQALNIIMTHM